MFCSMNSQANETQALKQGLRRLISPNEVLNKRWANQKSIIKESIVNKINEIKEDKE